MDKKHNEQVLVIGSDHYNTLWVVRTLGFCGIKSMVIVFSNKKKSFVLKSKYTRKGWVVNNVDLLVPTIKKICNSFKKPYVFVTDDVLSETIDRDYDSLKDICILSNCEGQKNCLGSWMDKWEMNKLARDVGFCIPWTKKIDLDNDSIYSVNMKYPCILKPLKSLYGTKNDVRICNNSGEFEQFVKEMKGRCNHYIVQEYIQPDFELTIDGLRCRNGNYTFFPGVVRKDKTCNSMCNMGMVTLAHIEKDIEKYIKTELLSAFLSRIDYDGLCSFDLFVKDGKTYFLETNLRTDGDMFIYTSAGINFPLIWILCHKGENIRQDNNVIIKNVYGMIEISYLKYANWYRPWNIVGDWWKTDCYSIFSWRDLKPFFYKFIYAI